MCQVVVKSWDSPSSAIAGFFIIVTTHPSTRCWVKISNLFIFGVGSRTPQPHKIAVTVFYSAVSLLRFCAWKSWQPSFKHQTNNFKPLFGDFYYFIGVFLKSLISNIYRQHIRLWLNCNHLMPREILSLRQNKSEKMPIK
jgi:hypothetical protein